MYRKGLALMIMTGRNGEFVMAKDSTKRAEAKSSATTAATGSTSGGRRPAAPDTNTSTDAATQTAPEPSAASKMAVVLIAPNPKRKGSKAFGFYAMYGNVGALTNLEAIRKAGVRGKDVSWDRDRRHILTGAEAEGFPINGSRDEKADYLRGLPESDGGVKISDKQLIAWGYMDAPAPVVEEAKAPVAADAKTA